MPSVTIEEAQSRLPDLIDSIAPGEELVITKDQRPVAKLARASESAKRAPRKAGSAKDTIHWMAPDFDEPLEEFREYME